MSLVLSLLSWILPLNLSKAQFLLHKNNERYSDENRKKRRVAENNDKEHPGVNFGIIKSYKRSDDPRYKQSVNCDNHNMLQDILWLSQIKPLL